VKPIFSYLKLLMSELKAPTPNTAIGDWFLALSGPLNETPAKSVCFEFEIVGRGGVDLSIERAWVRLVDSVQFP